MSPPRQWSTARSTTEWCRCRAVLALWHARLREGPSVATTFIESNAAAARMSESAEAYTSGEWRREYNDHRLEWMVKSGGINVVPAGLRDNTIRFPWPDPA
jgi:RNA polymerase-associated protein